jgi:hypothetical protein
MHGSAAEFLSALRAIDERLATDPLTFGEPRFHLKELRLEVRIAIVAPLAVSYAVHEEHPLVLPKTLRLLG